MEKEKERPRVEDLIETKGEKAMGNFTNKHMFTPGPAKMSKETLELGSLQTPYFRNEEFSKVILECEENLLEIVNAPKDSGFYYISSNRSCK